MTAAPAVAGPDPLAMVVRALVLYALAEVQAGHAKTLRVSVDGDAFSVADDGRGHALDKSLQGTPYLDFIYTHLDFPFDGARGGPVQLQGIGMSLVNALCAELCVTVRRHDETLQRWYRYGRLQRSQRTAGSGGETGGGAGNTVTGRVDRRLSAPALAPASQGTVPAPDVQAWLPGLLRTHPGLALYYNDRLLGPPAPDPT